MLTKISRITVLRLNSIFTYDFFMKRRCWSRSKLYCSLSAKPPLKLCFTAVVDQWELRQMNIPTEVYCSSYWTSIFELNLTVLQPLTCHSVEAGPPPPLDLSFWSLLTFFHHGIEKVERHLVWKLHKKNSKESWSNVPPKLVACIAWGFCAKFYTKSAVSESSIALARLNLTF